MLPHVRTLSGGFVQAWLAALSMGQEVVWEYSSRLPTTEMRRYFMQRYQGSFMGLGLVYTSLMSIPFVGLFVFLLSQVTLRDRERVQCVASFTACGADPTAFLSLPHLLFCSGTRFSYCAQGAGALLLIDILSRNQVKDRRVALLDEDLVPKAKAL